MNLTMEGAGQSAAAVWWFEHGGNRAGPVTTAELRGRALAGDVTPQTLVWREGMIDWQRLADVPEIATLIDDLRLAGPWARYFARCFDIVFVGGVLWLALTITRGLNRGEALMPSLAEHGVLLTALFVFSLPLIDAIIAAVFGNTPGKAMLGVRVVDARGKRASLPRYFGRNLLVGVVGLGFGIGLIAIGTQLWQFLRVRGGQAAAYDLWTKCRVLGRPVTDSQTIRFIVVALVLFGVWLIAMLSNPGMMLGGTDKSAGTAAQADASAPMPRARIDGSGMTPPAPVPPADTSFVWRNPVTQTAVRIEGIWMYTEASNRSGDRISLFATEDGQAVVTLGADIASKTSLSQYVANFMRANAEKYAFDNPGRIVRGGAGTAGSKWVAVARSRKQADARIQFEVIQRGQRFWYLALDLTKPYDKHARAVDILRETLQRSIGDGRESSL
ncbi:GYF domain-containing protein [Pandoraea sp.]|uniref:GYF domain-containing protein n=1 Tax=Pandoraea sp. TaxID=1883445 RepID=UPI0035AEF337